MINFKFTYNDITIIRITMLIGLKSLHNISLSMSNLAEDVRFLACIQVQHSSNTGRGANYTG
jgi:hypothetical protein